MENKTTGTRKMREALSRLTGEKVYCRIFRDVGAKSIRFKICKDFSDIPLFVIDREMKATFGNRVKQIEEYGNYLVVRMWR